jgi:hypothetical protein
MPWEWRNGSRLLQETAAANPVPLASPTACAIKGNISSSGERIYHLPGQQHYSATKISESKGERWFCERPRLKLLAGEKRNDRRPMSACEPGVHV